MNRRDFILGGLCLVSIAGNSVAVGNQFETIQSKPSFRLYNQLNFRGIPEGIKRQLSEIRVIYADKLWPDGIKRSELNRPYIRSKYAQQKNDQHPSMICLDVEHWRLNTTEGAERTKNIGLYVELLSEFKQLFPSSKIGLFEFFPTYNSPLWRQFANKKPDKAILETWRSLQRELAPIDHLVDVFYPQLYSRWPRDPNAWRSCALSILKYANAMAFDRPVIPFLWPQFWTNRRELVPGAYWRIMLDTVYEHADSAVLWSVYRTAPKWDDDFEWWRETQTFLKGLKIANG